MELTMLSRLILRRWWIIALPVVLSLIAAIPTLLDDSATGSGGFQAQIRYSAAQEFNLPQRDGDYQDVWLASELTVNAFTDWVRSSSFRNEIRAQLEDDEANLSALGIAADNARSIGVIYLSHPDNTVLQEIAAVAIAVLSQRNQGYFPQLGGESAQVTILEAPTVAAVPRQLPIGSRHCFALQSGFLSDLRCSSSPNTSIGVFTIMTTCADLESPSLGAFRGIQLDDFARILFTEFTNRTEQDGRQHV